ncbi:TPA: hypothetical protein H4D19_000304 [Escherichia coli]|nr:hypothetical protein [Escherichia coli]EJM8767255.1 hypothetical protein [Escherichia coli]HAL0421396.1 hypothetical protein [Escherichia coli]
MAKNDFKAFATDRNANVMSQEEWEALPALLSGFTAGKASSAQVNKVIRQASFIAAALAQFVSDKTQRDVLDNGDLPGFVELLGSGFAVEYLSRKNPFGDIKSDGTVQTALENLGLGEATFGAQNCVVFDKAGVSTWNVPDIVKKGRRVRVRVVGGGGSGGYPAINTTNPAGGGGGGGGGVSESVIDLTGISTVTITVGSGGTGQNTSASNGRQGGTSSFGTYLSATGGDGGGQISGGAGGEGIGGQINTSLGPGSPGASMISSGNSAVGGSGGGPGGNGQVLGSAENVAKGAKGPGGGGAGLATEKAGGVTGAGYSGIVIIYW